MWRPLPMWDIFAAQSGTFSTAIDSLRGVGLDEQPSLWGRSRTK